MAFNVGAVVAEIKADISNFELGMAKVKSSVSGLGDIASNVSSHIANASRQAMIFTGVIGAGLAVVGKVALDGAAKFEQYQIAFTTLLKDEAKATKAIKDIQTDAAKTPFELAPLVGANQRLISAGISAEKARLDILHLGDAISATGGGNAELERLSTNLQQIKAVGKASALDIKQFAFAGINVYQMLADVTGKNVSEVKEMGVSYELLSKAFEKASGKGGMFENAMIKQSKSLNGLISTLKDTVSLGLKDILVDSGLFEAIRSSVENLIPVLEKAVPKVVNVFKSIGIVLKGVVDMFSTGSFDGVRKGLEAFGVSLSPQMISMVLGLVQALRGLGAWIVANQELVITFLQGLGMALGALLVVGTLYGLLVVLLNPLTLITAAIALLYTVWQTNFLGIRDITVSVFSAIVAVISTAWTIISWVIQTGMSVISLATSNGLGYITSAWSRAVSSVTSFVSNMWSSIKNAFNAGVALLSSIGNSIITAITQPFVTAYDRVKSLVNKIKDALDFTKRHSPSVVDIVQAGVGKVNSALERLSVPLPEMKASMGFDSTSTSSINHIAVDMKGAYIGSEALAKDYGEMIGDNIIKKLQLNVRF